MKHKPKAHWTWTPVLLTGWLLFTCLATSWLAVHAFYISMCLSALLTVAAAWAVCRYMRQTTCLLSRFIQSVRYAEFPDTFGADCSGLPPELPECMQEALTQYRNRLQHQESRLHYFQALANHIDTAILVYTAQGSIEWLNDAASHLLAAYPSLPDRLRGLKPGTPSVLQIQQHDERIQLALSATEFIMQGKRLLVVSLKNIHSALDSQETLAWQKLIRVLTHEIMNSATPILSLTELLGKQVEQLEGGQTEKEEIQQMLDAIARRTQALTRFVNSYREVSHLPPPILEPLDAGSLLTETLRFMQDSTRDLQLDIPSVPLRVLADKGQIGQVLINLIRNARENEARHILLSAGVSPTGRVFLQVSDDGTGIEPDVQERIFVPFFTTKPGGSGIGLTLARQIMHQHGGTIDVRSHPDKGSTFTLLFPYN